MIKTESPWLQEMTLMQGTQVPKVRSRVIKFNWITAGKITADILLVSELHANLRCLVKTDPSHTRGPRWIPESVHIIIFNYNIKMYYWADVRLFR